MTPDCADVRSTMLDRSREARTLAKDSLSEDVRARLRLLMEREGLTTAEHLAQFVGVSKNTGYNWLSPGKLPSLLEFTLITREFSVDPAWLLALDPAGVATSAGEEAVVASDPKTVGRAGARAAARGAAGEARKRAAAKTPGGSGRRAGGSG